MNMTNRQAHVLVLVPAFREERRIAEVVRAVRAQGLDILVVDDGSDDRTAAEAEAAGARVLRHDRNRGKGAALSTGFQFARDHEYEAVVTLDADGQHRPEEIGRFVEAYIRTGLPVLVGNRMTEPTGMPLDRYWTNRFLSWLLSRMMGQKVPDTQCGFRLFHRDVLPDVATRSQGFAAESEILLNLAEQGIRIGAVPVSSVYRDEQSKIRPLADAIRLFRMLWQHRRKRRKP